MNKPQPLYQVIATSVSPDNLQMLAANLSVPFFDLAGGTHSLKAMNFQEWLANRGRLNELIAELHKQLPRYDLKPYLYLVIGDFFYTENAINELYEGFGLEVRDFLEPEKFAWGSEAWREQKALALQSYLEGEGKAGDLLEAIKEKEPAVNLAFYGEPPEKKEPKGPVGKDDEEKEPIKALVDFDIDVGDERDGKYPVKVIKSPAGESSKSSWQTFPEAETAAAMTFLRGLVGRPEDAEELGHTLRQFLFPQSVWNLFTRSQAMAPEGVRVRLRISQEAADLSRVPWEYCWGKKQFLALGRDTPIVRYIPTDEPPEAIAVGGKVRILAVMASPEDQEEIDLDAEEAWLTKAVAPLEEQGLVQLLVKKGVSRGDLFEVFEEYDPHILHYFGHGELQDDGEGALILERNGKSQPVNARRLMTLLRESNVKLVILSACETAAIAEEDAIAEEEDKKVTRPEDSRAFMGVAPRLVWAGIPAVVAMQFKVPVTTATMFMQDLYEKLTSRTPLDQAVTSARIGAYFKADDEVYWAIPVLFMRSPDGVIFQ